MIVQVLKKVPDDVFDNCIEELSAIKWGQVLDFRKKGVFETSTSIHLRTHDISKCVKIPTTIEEYSAIVNCVDNPMLVNRYPKHYNAALWIKEEVCGINLGRIMIVHLSPRGKVGIHIDPGEYFERHSRFHIPLKTNTGVQFFNEVGNKEHMPQGYLCRLNNRSFHGLINESDEERIHLIVDVEVTGGNSIF